MGESKKEQGSGEAVIATRRKPLDIEYKTMKYDWVFEDLSNLVVAKA
jgi:hypothetical protein